MTINKPYLKKNKSFKSHGKHFHCSKYQFLSKSTSFFVVPQALPLLWHKVLILCLMSPFFMRLCSNSSNSKYKAVVVKIWWVFPGYLVVISCGSSPVSLYFGWHKFTLKNWVHLQFWKYLKKSHGKHKYQLRIITCQPPFWLTHI